MINSAIIAWATDHWWLAFWLAFWAMAFGYGFLSYLLRAALRLVRAVVVLCHGWPPAHLDADGDWKPAPKPPKA